MAIPGRNNASGEHWIPSSIAAPKLRSLSAGTFGSLAFWTGWDSRACARTGGAGSEVYRDISVQKVERPKGKRAEVMVDFNM